MDKEKMNHFTEALLKRAEDFYFQVVFGFFAIVVLVSGLHLLTPPSSAQDTVIFDFDVAGDFTFDSDAVDISGGIVSLVSIDQVDDDNDATGGFAAGTHSDTQYDAGNSWLELDATGMTNGTGTFTSRIMDAGGDVSWDSIDWTPERPSLKELPNSAGTESGYSDGNVDMSDNILLMHFNESSWDGTTDEVIDSSGNGNHGTASGDADTTADGRFNRAGTFDGTTDLVLIPDDPSLEVTTEITAGGWFYWDTDINSNRMIAKGRTADSSLEYRLLTLDNGIFGFNDGLLVQVSADGSTLATQATCNGCLASFKDVWTFVAFTYDGSTLRLYINDTNIASASSTFTFHNGTTDLAISAENDGLFAFDGMIDEIFIFDTHFDDDELEDLRRRGAQRLQFQVRSCDDDACLGETFIGPDGTASTYYTEEDNTTTGLPSLTLTNVPDNQYFQYQATLETDDATLSPELTDITIGPAHVNASVPTITNNTGAPYVFLESFSQATGGSHTGEIEYQLSDDGVTYYYHDGNSWVAESGGGYPSETNTASEIDGIINFFAEEVAAGDLFFRAFLVSDEGTEIVQLDTLTLSLTEISGNSLPIVAPIVHDISYNEGVFCSPTREVTINLSVSNASQVIVSEDDNFLDAQYQTYQESIPFTLSEGDEEKTLYFLFRSQTQNLSALISSKVILDRTFMCTQIEDIPEGFATEEDMPELTEDQEGSMQEMSDEPSQEEQEMADIVPEVVEEVIEEVVPLLTPGDLVKADETTVYYYGIDEKLHAFPDPITFFSWYDNFDDVQVLTMQELEQFEQGQRVRARPGRVLLKTKEDNRVYSVDFGGILRWLSDAHIASVLYTQDWERFVKVIEEDTLNDYVVGANIEAPGVYNPVLQRARAIDIDTDLGLKEPNVVEREEDGSIIETTCKKGRNFTRFMTNDFTSPEVRALQNLLQCLGYFPEDVATTAFYGDVTIDAVAAFQEDHGINPVGYVGPETRELLNSYE